MSPDKRLLNELHGAVADMAAVVATLTEKLPDDEWQRIRDRVGGMERHIGKANEIAAAHQPAKQKDHL